MANIRAMSTVIPLIRGALELSREPVSSANTPVTHRTTIRAI
jgi:hypothetical protein